MTTYIPQPKRDCSNKVQGEFYPLQREELIELRKQKILHNAAFVHFALRLENPFCDRPVTIDFREFCSSWELPEVSLYKSLAKLREKDVLETKDGKLTLTWKEIENISFDDEPITDYQDGKSIIKVDNPLSELITDYQDGKFRPSKPMPGEVLPVLQTNKTNSDFLQTNTNLETDPPLPPKGNSQNSTQQVEIFDSQQPNSQAATEEIIDISSNQQLQEKHIQGSIISVIDSSSAHVEQKINKKTQQKFTQAKADWLIEQYNQNKPPTWARCRKCTSKLMRDLSKLYTEFGDDLASRWLDALKYPVEINDWWSSGNNRSILTLLRSDRVAEWSDAAQARQNGEKPMTEKDLKMAKSYADTMAAIADL